MLQLPAPVLHFAMLALIISGTTALMIASNRALRQVRAELRELAAELGWRNVHIPWFTTGMSVPLSASFEETAVAAVFHARDRAVPPRLTLSHEIGRTGELTMYLRPSPSNFFTRPLFAKADQGGQFDSRFVIHTEELALASTLFADRELIEELHDLFQRHNASLRVHKNRLSLSSQVEEGAPRMLTGAIGVRRSIFRPARENIVGLAREEWQLLRRIVTRLA
jgi:hypothetical protein